ncbi:MAG TPA: hypothetical protein PK280_00870 [Planctomycetota bacterium]|nr:hypothetical protein [Planctomycetota bacterium]
MAAATGLFAMVLIDEAVPPLGNEIYGELARTLGRVRYDVMAAFKRSPGIPFEDLAEDQALAAVRLFTDAGIPAAAVDSAALPAPARVFVVHRVGLGGEGLSVQTELTGAMRVLPWDGLAAVAAATLTEGGGPGRGPGGPSVGALVAGAATTLATGIPIGFPGRTTRSPAPAPRAAAHQVLAVSPRDADFELRFRAAELGYDFLGERMTSSSAQNFRLFADEVIGRAPAAKVAGAARELAARGAAPPAMEADVFSLHNRWLRTLAAQGL